MGSDGCIGTRGHGGTRERGSEGPRWSLWAGFVHAVYAACTPNNHLWEGVPMGAVLTGGHTGHK